jgi:hypothetical protein
LLGIKYDKQQYKSLIEKSKESTLKMMKENSLLMSMPILHDFYESQAGNIVGVIFGALFSILIFGIPLLINSIKGLINPPVLQIALKYGFEEKDIEDYKLQEYVYSGKKENNEKEMEKILEENKSFFEKIIKFTNGCQLVIKSFEIFQNVFKSLEKFNNTDNDEWNRFTENII